jgi:hypothetical protein
MVPESFPVMTPFNVVSGDHEAVRSPETVYLEVPDKPPKGV